MKLNIPFEQFKTLIKGHIKAAEIFSRINLESEQELLEGIQTLKDWRNRCVETMIDAFGNSNNELINEFKSVGTNEFNFPGMKNDFEFRKDKHHQLLKSCIAQLNDTLTLLSLCDPVIEGDKYDPKGREDLTTEQKMFFLLFKLKQVYDGREYPINWIFKENDIKLNHINEGREIAKEMELMGLIKIGSGIGNSLMAGITIAGKMKLEEIMSKKSENSKPVTTAVNNIHIQEMHNSVIQQGNYQSTQSTSISNEGINELKSFLSEIKSSIDSLNLTLEDKQELESEIQTVEIQTQSPKPKNIIITESLKTIRKIFESITTTAISPTIIEKAKHLIEMFQLN